MASKNSTESVNCFNSVQSSGVVLVLDKNLTIVQASHNVCHHLNIENIFNSNIETVLAVEKEFLIECLSELNTTPLLLPITVNQFCIFAHSNNNHIVVELEPVKASSYLKTLRLFKQFEELEFNTTSILSCCELITSQLARLTDCDRVIICRLTAEADGQIVAETTSVTPILNQFWSVNNSFQTYKQKKFEVIYENNPNVNLIPKLSLIDTKFCHLEPTSEEQRMLMRQFSISSMLTIPVVVRGKLWGMVSLHNLKTKTFDASLLVTAPLISEMVSSKVTWQHEQEEKATLELRIKESNQRLAETQRVAKTGSWEWQTESGIINWSDEVLNILGIDQRQTISITSLLNEYINPEEYEKVANRGESLPTDYPIMLPDGRTKYIHSEVDIYKDAKGFPVKMVGTLQDVTERVLYEQALRESESQFRQLTNTIQDAFILTNADYKNLKVLYVSPAYEEIWGQSCDTLYQNPWSWIEAIHPEDKAVLEIVDPTTTEKTNNQYRIVRPDGSIRWVMSRRYPIKEASGKVYRWARVVTDITEQKKFEAALQESEIRFKQLAENISDIFFIIDPLTLKWLYVSPAYEKIWGQKIEELEENFWKWFDLIHTNDALKTKEHANRYIVEWQPNSLSYEYRIMRPDGVRWLMTRTYPIKNSDGEVYRIAGITTDITEQKNTEEWMQNIIREKETLIQEIHHRVKNNLSIISGLFELQLDSINDQQIRLFLIDCQNRIDMMASIHERLYKAEDLSSIYLPEHISDMVSHILDIYSIDQSKIEVTIDIDNIFVEINQAIPFSIIINELVTNSLKHAFPQKTCGKISITSVTKDDYHCFIISDTGIGIAAGFDLEKTESLGLKLVYLLAKQLKGSIVHCQNLIGTVFRLTFPILSNR